MFEGVVSQVLAGLLRRYVKGIQKEQLKIGFWNGRSSIPLPSLSTAASPNHAQTSTPLRCNSCLSCCCSICFGIM
jgi:hypothetical protein